MTDEPTEADDLPAWLEQRHVRDDFSGDYCDECGQVYPCKVVQAAARIRLLEAAEQTASELYERERNEVDSLLARAEKAEAEVARLTEADDHLTALGDALADAARAVPLDMRTSEAERLDLTAAIDAWVNR
jgi:hypothetical protein